MSLISRSYIFRLAGIGLVILITASCRKHSSSYTFETAEVKKGSIVNSVTATGTLQATTTVQVGTQVSGVIKKIFVDFNSNVKKGQLLAQLDKTPLLSSVQQAEAALEDARSNVEFQKATFARYQALIDKKLVAQADFDQVKYNYDKALADLKNAQAAYDKAIVNLNYASIYSPIDGVVLNRAVDQGQTVAASFNTPTLFTIANDLRSMQVEANVDEADIGQVLPGQSVDFNVDAYPDITFTGRVKEVRLQPVVTNNVVTYTVVIDAPNPDKKLMPGMTANITVYVQKIDSVLTVPGKALKFSPDPSYLASLGKNNQQIRSSYGAAGAAGNEGAGYRNFRNGGAPDPKGSHNIKHDAVWIKTTDGLRRIPVLTGPSDAVNTEITGGLKAGDEVILAMTSTVKSKKPDNSSAENRSPFMPQRPGRGSTTRR